MESRFGTQDNRTQDSEGGSRRFGRIKKGIITADMVRPGFGLLVLGGYHFHVTIITPAKVVFLG